MNIRRKNRKEINDLKVALEHCKDSAKTGYRIAHENLNETSNSVKNAVQNLIGFMGDYHRGGVHSPEIIDKLKIQYDTIIEELELLRVKSYDDLEDRKKDLDVFSITLFGRTMAGKSTFMEILTKGNGASIGNGAQRKTRDVRHYYWKGLEVTDVPGVAAFEGQEDEQLAYHAASKADLVVFLITDDAPQSIEAECYAQVRKLGKPILGVINIKSSIENPDDIALFLRNSSKLFDTNRIKDIVTQFNIFADNFIPGKHTYFHATHLLSRYLADQQQFNKVMPKLIDESRFTIIEQAIIGEVLVRGSFLRIKSFLDSAVDPILDITNILLEFGDQNSSSGRVLVKKSRQFNTWAVDFKKDGSSRINILVLKIIGKLRQDVYNFVEENYSNKSAGELWENHVRSEGIESKCRSLLGSLNDECKIKIQDFARELQKELSFVASFKIDKTIKMKGIFDSKRLWNWGTTITSSGLFVVAAILGSGPIGWAAAAVGITGWLFSLLFIDREVKVKRARENLSNILRTSIDKMENNLTNQLFDYFESELLEKQVNTLRNDIHDVTTALFNLSDAQRTLAWTLNDRVKHLHRILLDEACRHLDIDLGSIEISDIARIPGSAMTIMIPDKSKFPDKPKEILESLLNESIWFVANTYNTRSEIAQTIGKECDIESVSLEEKIKVAHVHIESLSPSGLVRVKLAQQLSGYHIIKN